MAYPPLPHTEKSNAKIQELVREFPFGHMFSTGPDGHHVTRLPFAMDTDGDEIVALRAHFNAQNPQRDHLDGADVLIAFSGPDSYVSPNWRVDKGRGATWDYKAVKVWGTARIRNERAFFEQLINDLAANSERKFEGLTEYPNWSIKDAPIDYVDRLFPKLTSFEVTVSRVEAISKLHQDFPAEDRQSVADHLKKSPYANSHDIGELIERDVRGKGGDA
ncbi:MAG: FMN-binding negative transcriptional regulator [Pseudomonadota bacterium]